MADIVTWTGDIRPMFAPYVECMKNHGGVKLDDYYYCRDFYGKLYEHLSLPIEDPAHMPKGVDEEGNKLVLDYAKFKQWKDGGFVVSPAPRVRKNVRLLDSEEEDLLRKAFAGIQEQTANHPNGIYYEVAGVHGEPGSTWCQHHIPGFCAWHREYITRFEDALRTIEGCESVSMPYWDIIETLHLDAMPKLLSCDPCDSEFGRYTLPETIGHSESKLTTPQKKGEGTVRYDDKTVILFLRLGKVDQFLQRCIKNTLEADDYDWDKYFADIVQAHDTTHTAVGRTMGSQETASFDPIFWFFHCGLDWVWSQWQMNNDAVCVEGYKKQLPEEDHQYLTDKLGPWDDTYESEIAQIAEYVPVKADVPDDCHGPGIFLGHLKNTFSVDNGMTLVLDKVDRMNVQGTFTVELWHKEALLLRVGFFQTRSPKKCDSCVKAPLAQFHFLLQDGDFDPKEPFSVKFIGADGEDISDKVGNFRVQIKRGLKKLREGGD